MWLVIGILGKSSSTWSGHFTNVYSQNQIWCQINRTFRLAFRHALHFSVLATVRWLNEMKTTKKKQNASKANWNDVWSHWPIWTAAATTKTISVNNSNRRHQIVSTCHFQSFAIFISINWKYDIWRKWTMTAAQNRCVCVCPQTFSCPSHWSDVLNNV